MEKIIQIDKNQWVEQGHPIDMCVIPFYPKELIEKYKIQFSEFDDNGLGLCQFAVVEVNNHKYWLCAYPNGPDMAHFITVKILSYDSNPIDACTTICSVLDISEKQLLWRRKDLSMPRWRLVRLEDNGNEFEMFQFMERSSAEWSVNKLDTKGHKQKYIIKEKTEPN